MHKGGTLNGSPGNPHCGPILHYLTVRLHESHFIYPTLSFLSYWKEGTDFMVSWNDRGRPALAKLLIGHVARCCWSRWGASSAPAASCPQAPSTFSPASKPDLSFARLVPNTFAAHDFKCTYYLIYVSSRFYLLLDNLIWQRKPC